MQSAPSPYARRVGAAAVLCHLDENGDCASLAWHLTSVPGKQTVPRAECVGANAAMALAKRAGVSAPRVHVDASYVVQGIPKLSARVSEGTNQDVWAALGDGLDQLNPSIIKVKAHTTVAQVARGEVAWESYIGNALADVLSKVAAKCSELPDLVSECIEKEERLAFLICMRIACIEHLFREDQDEVRDWELTDATGPLSQDAISEWVRRGGSNGHSLVRLATGRVRCKTCGSTCSDARALHWLREPCGGNLARRPSELNSRATHVFRGTFPEYLREQAKQHKRHRQAAASNSKRYSTMAIKYLNSAAGAPEFGEGAGPVPGWAQEIHDSHNHLVHGGGFVCCVRCGALAASHHKRSGLFSACPVVAREGWTLPEGSKWRLARLKAGLHPEGKSGRYWPDGRSAAVQLQLRLARKPSVQAEGVLAAVGSSDWLDQLLEAEEDRLAADSRVKEIYERTEEAVDLAGPGGLVDLAFAGSYVAQEVRRAFVNFVATEVALPEGWEEQHRHFTEAQLLHWPAVAGGNCVGFGNAVLALEECIATYRKTYCSAELYPEDLPIFTELGDTDRSEIALAASFIASMFDLHAENLQEATTYAERELLKLARAQG